VQKHLAANFSVAFDHPTESLRAERLEMARLRLHVMNLTHTQSVNQSLAPLMKLASASLECVILTLLASGVSKIQTLPTTCGGYYFLGARKHNSRPHVFS
jgi:hypothetical protein